jgi:polyferredoxin
MIPNATWVRPPARAGLHKARRAFQIVTSFLFIIAPFIDLLRFDLKNGRLILFGVHLGLGELGVAYAILLASFILVFAGALLYGRIYCGWMCPQTTLSELVATLERWVCPKRGERTAKCKVMSVAASLVVALFVSWSLVAYFLDRSEWFWPSATVWIVWLITAGVLAADFLWLRHRFCVGVCPYGLLQNIIQDNRTLGVELDPARASECTNCLLCVRACFMGVDIRKQAFDPMCLNCGDCIAATRIAKTCPEEPLIRFRYGTQPSRWPAWLRKTGILDGRRAVVAGLFFLSVAATAFATGSRTDLDLQIAGQFDKTRVDAQGSVQNEYKLTLGNRLRQPVKLTLQVEGVPGLTVLEPTGELALAADERSLRQVILAAPAGSNPAGAHPIKVRTLDGGKVVGELSAIFFVPEKG